MLADRPPSSRSEPPQVENGNPGCHPGISLPWIVKSLAGWLVLGEMCQVGTYCYCSTEPKTHSPSVPSLADWGGAICESDLDFN